MVNDLGDVTTAADDKCSRTSYADNTGAWMVNYPSRAETVTVNCSVTPDRSTQVVSDIRTYYDNGGFGDGPTIGNVTKTDKIASQDDSIATYVTQGETSYDGYGRPTKATDAAGHAATTAYIDTQGLTTQVTTTGPPADAGDASTSLTSTQQFDPAWGVPVTELDVSNNNLRTDLTYDPLGRLQKVWLPDQRKATDYPNYEYSYRVTDGQIVAVTTKTLDADGKQKLGQIEMLDGLLRTRQIQVPGPDGRLISDTFYDNRGQVTTTYAPYTATGTPEATLFGVYTPGQIETQTHTEHDGLGRTTAERLTTGNGEQPDSELWRTTYDYGGGNRVSITPPAGGIPTAQLTNARGQVTERRQYKAATPTGDYDATTYTYTPAGEIASVTDPSGNTFTTTYDLRGRKTRTTDPDKGTTTFNYNDLDQVTSTTDARGKKIFIDYDGQGRKTATHDGADDGPVLASWAYDTAQRGKGKLASATRHTSDGDYTTGVYEYDTLGRPAFNTLTIPASQGPLAGAYGFSTSYNADGTIQGQTHPAAGGLPGEAVIHTYDTWQRPTGLIGNNTTYINTAQYTRTGKLVLLEYGTDPSKQAWQQFTYEKGTQRLDSARTYRAGGGGADRHATYHYTDAGTITSITDTSRDGVDNQCFTYDHLQRLTQAWTQNTTDPCTTEPTTSVIGGPAPYWHTFTYDTAGNRKTQTLHGTGGETDTTRTYTYADPGHGNRLNQMVQTGGDGDRTDTYAYDATGNTTTRTVGTSPPGQGQTLNWDTEGELTEVTENGATTSYIYDADGNRLMRKDATGTTLYMPDGTELRALTGATTATGTRYYTFAGQTVATRTSDGTITYLTADTQGTAQVAINAANQQTTIRRSDPFGNIRGLDEDATWPNDKGFVGGTQEPTGLTHLGAREYDSQTGRFISVDPLMDQADPQQMNGYTYANNNPATHADPNGLLLDGGGLCGVTPSNPCNEPGGGGGGGGGGTGGGSSDWDSAYPSGMKLPPRSMPVKQRRIALRRVILFMETSAKDTQSLARAGLAKKAFCAEYVGDDFCAPAPLPGGPFQHQVEACAAGDPWECLSAGMNVAVTAATWWPGKIKGSLGRAKGTRLEAHERGAWNGHTIRNHVGKSNKELIKRAMAEPNRSYISTWRTKHDAEFNISMTLLANGKDIEAFLAGTGKTTTLRGPVDSGAGIVYQHSTGKFYEPNFTRVDIMRVPNSPSGFKIITAYPGFNPSRTVGVP